MNWSVRPGRREDSAEVWMLVEGLAEFENLTEFLTGSAAELEKWVFDDPVASLLVAEDGSGQIVGYAIYFRSFGTFSMKPGLFLEDLFVLPTFRGHGIGKALIQQVIQVAREKRYGRVDWTVLDWNENAIGFYRSLDAELLPEWRICRFVL